MESEITVMLVTGNELMGVERLREMFFSAGYKVLAVETGQIKEAFYHSKPDLVVANLCDVQAADLVLCQLLHRLAHCPLMAIGSSKDEAFRAGMLEMLVDDFITRPVNARELIARARNLLRRTHPHAAPNAAEAQPVFLPVPATRRRLPSLVKSMLRGLGYHGTKMYELD